MTLRSLLEKATEKVKLARDYGGEVRAAHIGEGLYMWRVVFPTQDDAKLFVALHNCAEELLRVAECAERFFEAHDDASPDQGEVFDAVADIRAALAALREKEGRI